MDVPQRPDDPPCRMAVHLLRDCPHVFGELRVTEQRAHPCVPLGEHLERVLRADGHHRKSLGDQIARDVLVKGVTEAVDEHPARLAPSARPPEPVAVQLQAGRRADVRTAELAVLDAKRRRRLDVAV